MKFKDLLKRTGWTGYALAKALNVSAQNVYSWERRRCSPDPETILKIKDILKVSAEDVLLSFVQD